MTLSRPFHGLSFDELSSLAATDPDRFEALRSALIERAINESGGNVAQLTALQERLSQGGDPSAPRCLDCLRLSKWLDDSYRRLARTLNHARAQGEAPGDVQ
jgi:hypothetical protein